MTYYLMQDSEVLTTERCYIRELLNDPSLPEASLARTRVMPGVTTELHALSVLEWYVIESGQGLMRVGDAAPYPVGPGDSIEIPAGIDQQITNVGDGDLLFLCVCVPRFEALKYLSRE
ncbi:MAG: cupin domain-containing protein [Gammaproteobacteria bacterium]|nr:cupin domain-containing protein [Gammaproteobacteria bacterium]NNC77347.1 cupin domain-containing protein [Woeseiaceae bacterium]